MNRMKHLLTAIVILAVLVGCVKKVDVAFTASSVSIAPEGATVEATLTSNGQWSVEAYPEWLSVSPTSGKGDATLTLTALANNSGESRSGEVRVTTKDNSASLTVTQEQSQAESNFITVSPTTIDADVNGGTFEVTVTANCQWTANTTAEWVVCEPASGDGNGTVTVSVSPNTGDVSERETDLVFAGADNILVPVRVTQHSPQLYYLSATPGIVTFEYTGGTEQVNVHSNDNWTASCDADWITLSATSGDGDAVLSVVATENPMMLEARIAEILFHSNTGASASVQVKQEGAPDPHFLEVNPMELIFSKEGGTAEVSISCDTDWQTEIDCEWATLSEQTGTGNGTLTLTVAPNPVAAPRSVSLRVVSGTLVQTAIINQRAGEEPLVGYFSPSTITPSYMGGFQHVNLFSNTSWQLETSSDWISLLTTSGTGDASLDIVIDGNNSPDERSGYINIKNNGQVLGALIVIQEGKPNLFETNITELEARPEGGEYTIQLTANQSWTLNYDVDWLTCSPESGLGSSAIVVTVEALSNLRPRTGHIKIVGSTGVMIMVTVEQHN